jgi:hypothetical protein
MRESTGSPSDEIYGLLGGLKRIVSWIGPESAMLRRKAAAEDRDPCQCMCMAA